MANISCEASVGQCGFIGDDVRVGKVGLTLCTTNRSGWISGDVQIREDDGAPIYTVEATDSFGLATDVRDAIAIAAFKAYHGAVDDLSAEEVMPFIPNFAAWLGQQFDADRAAQLGRAIESALASNGVVEASFL